ncbi:hypothetical protein EMIT0133MI5_60030 [Bacillus velezensis]|nr:protein of unknown function [Bacillus velezensis UCMB5033]
MKEADNSLFFFMRKKPGMNLAYKKGRNDNVKGIDGFWCKSAYILFCR